MHLNHALDIFNSVPGSKAVNPAASEVVAAAAAPVNLLLPPSSLPVIFFFVVFGLKESD